jgi:predicted O-methyltransferase YrrM
MFKRVISKILWRAFPLWERLGLHVLPVHFYSPIPDTRELKAHPEWFAADHPMTGVDMRELEELQLLEKLGKAWEADYKLAGGDAFGLEERKMPSFAPANALVLYALIRELGPKRMIEVGSGMSTRISSAAFRDNARAGKPGIFTAIEPYPSTALKAGYDGLSELLVTKVEDVPLERFQELEKNDILFIDSSHTVKIGGDVNYLFFRILPLLKPGVIIHVHDIFFPREYLPHHFFNSGVKQIWQEQYLLHSFLMFNSEFEVLLCSSYLHFKRLQDLKNLFPWYHENRCPSSFWMRRKAT